MRLSHKLPYEWQVGWRYTRAGKRGRRQRFISFISFISIAGIGLGVAALIVVLSVMNGFQKEVAGRMLSILAHVEITDARGEMPYWEQARAEVLRHPEVRGAAPFMETQGMLVSGDTLKPALVRGVLPAAERGVSELPQRVKTGSLDALKPGAHQIVLGRELAKALGVGLGDRVGVAIAQGDIMGEGSMPRVQPFTVAGIFDAGHYEYDSTLAYVDLQDGESLAGLSAPSGIRVRVADPFRAEAVARELARTMSGDVRLVPWTLLNSTWFAAVASQKRMMFIILALIMAVAAFNLVSTLVMTVTDKKADIAILRTIGASPRSIMKIFIVQGTLTGLMGAGLGVLLGVLFALNIGTIVPAIESALGMHILNPEIYFISTVPSDVHWGDVAAIGGVAIALAFLSTIYPSWSAARVNPAEGLRYE